MKSINARALLYGLVILLGAFFAAPNILTENMAEKLPNWYGEQKVALGLDLRGGSQLLLAIDEKTLFQQEHQRLADEAGKVLRQERIAHGRISVSDRELSIPLRDEARAQEAQAIVAPLLQETGALNAPYTLSVKGKNVVVEATITHRKTLLDDAVERSLEVVRRRLNETGLVDPTIVRQGGDSILVQMPGLDDPAAVRELLGTTAQMSFHWVADSRSTGQRIPVKMYNNDPNALEQEMMLEREVAMKGEHIRDAQMGFNAESGQAVVNFRLDRPGASLFGELTRANIGRALAIVLDDRIVTAPVIRSVIGGGQGEISGAFTTQEASQVALLLRSGALPAPLTVVEERTIGPDLGQDAINMGIGTGVFGFCLVVIFMIMAYGRWGMVASVALFFNIIITFAVLSVLGATLTLPGIAGLILSVGMAIDANVLINERIREETHAGRSPRRALDLGFHNAYRAIIDSNITSLIAVSLLFLFGTGPVRGFAVTMAVGLVTSLFTAVAVTRLMMEYATEGKKDPFSDSWMARVVLKYTKEPWNILKGRIVGLATSTVLSVGSVILMLTVGLNYGIDFLGGTVVETHLPSQVQNEEVRHHLESRNLSHVALQELGGDGEFLLRIPMSSDQDPEEANRLANEVKDVVLEKWPEAVFQRTEMVGSKVSGQFADLTILAIILAGLGMQVYLWARFESHFALASTLTIALDLTKTMGFFALSGVEFNLTAVAALLALMGYSVNDKVVIFDRIREHMQQNPNIGLKEALNSSVTLTLGRTLFTSFSTLLVLVPMTIYGGPAVASFAQPMVFGVLIGTSSSVFVASPILYYLALRRERKGLPQLRKSKEELQKELDLIP